MTLESMINDQIISRGIRDQRVLNAFRSVDRKYYLPEDERELSYIDSPVSIGYGQTISQPYIVAYMLEYLKIEATDKVLEIGTGSGYQTALLSHLAGSVYSTEIVKPLYEQAQKRLEKFSNVHLNLSVNELGWPAKQPFDKIIVSAAAYRMPMTLIEQLRDGGQMIIPVGEFYQELVLVTRKGSKYDNQYLLPVRFVPLIT